MVVVGARSASYDGNRTAAGDVAKRGGAHWVPWVEPVR
jgi:hypothetical protein